MYAKRPFAGPEQVLNYVARYTHRVAISNNRLISLQDGCVPSAGTMLMAIAAPMSLDAQEFIRRFLLHILPKSFMRIRHYGFLANRTKAESSPAAGGSSTRRSRHHPNRSTPFCCE